PRPELLQLLGRPDVAQRHPEELLLAPAIVLHRRRVHREERQALQVVDPHRERVAPEERAEAREGPVEAVEGGHAARSTAGRSRISRTRASSSSRVQGFCTKPAVPAARSGRSCRAYPLVKRNRGRRGSQRVASWSSGPESRGITTSVITSCTGAPPSVNRASAVSPSSLISTTYPARSRRRCATRRISGWSSTRRIR